MECDIRSQAGLVRAKSTKNRGDYLMPVLLQERGKQIPRTIGLPCAVYQDKGRHGGKVYQVRLRPEALIFVDECNREWVLKKCVIGELFQSR